MDFRDELRAILKTPEQVENEANSKSIEEGKKVAERHIEYVKRIIRNHAESGGGCGCHRGKPGHCGLPGCGYHRRAGGHRHRGCFVWRGDRGHGKGCGPKPGAAGAFAL